MIITTSKKEAADKSTHIIVIITTTFSAFIQVKKRRRNFEELCVYAMISLVSRENGVKIDRERRRKNHRKKDDNYKGTVIIIDARCTHTFEKAIKFSAMITDIIIIPL